MLPQKFAEELSMRYMETSAKTADNVEDTFMLVAAEIKEKCVCRVSQFVANRSEPGCAIAAA